MKRIYVINEVCRIEVDNLSLIAKVNMMMN
jgi:hypothetical protein